MENRKEFTYLSSDGKTPIHAVVWSPEGEVRAVLQIVHGVAEHILRYEHFALFMNAQGFLVVGEDHIGHGLSLAEGATPLYFGEKDGWEHLVDDIHTLRERIGAEHPTLPYLMLGHSMGSFLARSYLIRYPGTLHAAIIMGTGQMSALVLSGGRALAAVLGKVQGRDQVSLTVEKIAFGPYNKPFAPNRTAYDWLSINEANVDAYIADPLCGSAVTIGLFADMLGGMSFNQTHSNLEKMDKTTPTLFISGEKDPVGDMGRGVRAAEASFRDIGMHDVTLKLYPELRHEILNEDCREVVYNDILAWIEGKL